MAEGRWLGMAMLEDYARATDGMSIFYTIWIAPRRRTPAIPSAG
jgi:hypothetical protein